MRRQWQSAGLLVNVHLSAEVHLPPMLLHDDAPGGWSDEQSPSVLPIRLRVSSRADELPLCTTGATTSRRARRRGTVTNLRGISRHAGGGRPPERFEGRPVPWRPGARCCRRLHTRCAGDNMDGSPAGMTCWPGGRQGGQIGNLRGGGKTVTRRQFPGRTLTEERAPRTERPSCSLSMSFVAAVRSRSPSPSLFHSRSPSCSRRALPGPRSRSPRPCSGVQGRSSCQSLFAVAAGCRSTSSGIGIGGLNSGAVVLNAAWAGVFGYRGRDPEFQNRAWALPRPKPTPIGIVPARESFWKPGVPFGVPGGGAGPPPRGSRPPRGPF